MERIKMRFKGTMIRVGMKQKAGENQGLRSIRTMCNLSRPEAEGAKEEKK